MKGAAIAESVLGEVAKSSNLLAMGKQKTTRKFSVAKKVRPPSSPRVAPASPALCASTRHHTRARAAALQNGHREVLRADRAGATTVPCSASGAANNTRGTTTCAEKRFPPRA